jgi:predicted ATPase
MMQRLPLSSGTLIGRDTELQRLRSAVGIAVDTTPGTTPGTASGTAPGGLVVLSGDAGIGKTRLLDRLVGDAEASGWSSAVGHCVGQAGGAVAYLPFVELVGALDALQPDVVEQVIEAHPSLRRLRAGRAGRAAEPSAQASGFGPAAPEQVAEGVHALLTAVGAMTPTLVVVEDAHRADCSSRDLLTLLLTRGFTSAVALLVSYRSDDLHRRHPLHETLAVWARIAGVAHVELDPLPDAAVRELVVGLPGTPTDAGTADVIVRRSEGNPFFAEELLASASAGQSLTGGLGRVLRARVETLDDTAQRVLHVIALKGGRFLGHELLSRVSGLPDDALEAAVEAAVEHHVLEACWPPAYTFRHALMGETVADTMLPGERLRLHRSYADVLAARPDLAPASELARHAAAVGDLTTAVRASCAAAEAALALGGAQEALHHFEAALSWLDEKQENDEERDTLTLRASDAAMLAGDALRAVRLVRDRLDHPGRGQRPGRGPTCSPPW